MSEPREIPLAELEEVWLAAKEWADARRVLIDRTAKEGEWDSKVAHRLAIAEANLKGLFERRDRG